MRAAYYVEGETKQVVLMAESDLEQAMLEDIAEGKVTILKGKGEFASCQGGWVRFFDRKRDVGMFYSREECEKYDCLFLRIGEKTEEAADAWQQGDA